MTACVCVCVPVYVRVAWHRRLEVPKQHQRAPAQQHAALASAVVAMEQLKQAGVKTGEAAGNAAAAVQHAFTGTRDGTQEKAHEVRLQGHLRQPWHTNYDVLRRSCLSCAVL